MCEMVITSYQFCESRWFQALWGVRPVLVEVVQPATGQKRLWCWSARRADMYGRHIIGVACGGAGPGRRVDGRRVCVGTCTTQRKARGGTAAREGTTVQASQSLKVQDILHHTMMQAIFTRL